MTLIDGDDAASRAAHMLRGLLTRVSRDVELVAHVSLAPVARCASVTALADASGQFAVTSKEIPCLLAQGISRQLLELPS